MSYKCRIFTSDTQCLQDVVDYSVEGNDIKFVTDSNANEYSVDETEYIVIPTTTLKELIDRIYSNQTSKDITKPKKVRTTNIKCEDKMNKPEV